MEETVKEKDQPKAKDCWLAFVKQMLCEVQLMARHATRIGLKIPQETPLVLRNVGNLLDQAEQQDV